jgi:carbon-monoxide dehydrogenase large subunit
MSTQRFVGAPVKRREDGRLLTGRGSFVDDLSIPGVVHAAILRSPHAHARIKRVDLSKARAMLGVISAISGEDLDLPALAPRMGSPIPGTELRAAPRRALPRDKVRHVGEAVAVVVAESRYLAEDARDAIEVKYEVLPAIVSPSDGVAPNAPLVWEELGDNIAAHIVQRVGDPDRAFASAPHVLRETFRIVRGGGHSMEGRGLVARYDEALDTFTVWDASQGPYGVRNALANLFGMPEHKIRVISPPDIGGGFGPKGGFYVEEAIIPWLSRHLKRPVKWIEDRYEHFIAAAQERVQVHTTEIAYDDDGRLLALKNVFLHDTGASGILVSPVITSCTVPGPYRIRNIHTEFRAVYTNLQPSGAVRGAGRPQGTFVMERMMDRMAEERGLDPAEVRARNFIQPDEFPYDVGLIFRDSTRQVYDSGNYPGLLRRALEEIDYAGARAEQAKLRAEGRCRGIGIAICVEGVGFGPFEGCVMRLDARGRVVVSESAPPQGQGYQTTFAQIAADAIGVRLEDVEVVTGDTGAVPFGTGSFASRVMANAATAVMQAGSALRERILSLAGFLLEAAAVDLEIEDGRIHVRGANVKSVSLAEVARLGNVGTGFGFSLPAEVKPGLETSSYFAPPQAGYSSSIHACVLDVDPETGVVDIVRYVVGHDCGKLLNPLIVEGQILGGVAHGLSNALYEEAVFDESGQPLASSYLDYVLPSAREMPRVRIFHQESPSPLNPLGVKGAGEAGTLPVTAALAGAVEDALRPFNVRINRIPLNPSRISDLVHGR